jgi:hypothetical protein
MARRARASSARLDKLKLIPQNRSWLRIPRGDRSLTVAAQTGAARVSKRTFDT